MPRTRRPIPLRLVAVLAGCGADGASAPTTPAPASPGSTMQALRPVETSPSGGHTALGAGGVVPELVITMASAVDLAVRPGDDALYIVEHDGRVVRVAGDESVIVPDISDRLVGHLDEQGLTGLEFSGDGATAWIHATDAEGATTISEIPVGPDGVFDIAAERVLIDVGGPPGVNRNAGDLLRLDDGTLLIILGDGQAPNRSEPGRRGTPDPYRNGSDPSTLRGSILRVRPTPGGPEPYEIPDDNPFADGPLRADDGTEVDGLPEVFAWGFRNPWKLDVDPATGALWIGDVGTSVAEEIDVVFPGDDGPAGWAADFGWSRFEGTETQNDDVEAVFREPIDPVLTYSHEGAKCAISGGVVYRGEAIPDLRSGYVFGDFCEGSVWVLDATTGTARALLGGPDAAGDVQSIPGVTGIRTGPDGELYVLSWYGEVYRLAPA